MSADKILKENNIVLPEAPAPVGSYLASKIVGKLLYISGQITMNSKGELIKGKLGKDLNTEDGYKAAERCALSILAQAKKILFSFNLLSALIYFFSFYFYRILFFSQSKSMPLPL